MLPFLRSDLAQLVAYTPHPGGVSGHSDPSSQTEILLDRLDTNENPYDLPDDLKQKLAWSYQQAIESNRYPDGGHALLKQAIAEYVTESTNLSSETITPDQVSVGNGSDELIRSLLIATCLGGAGSILVAKPTFSMYGILAQTLGIPVVTVDRSDTTFELDLAAADAAVQQSGIEQSQPPIRVVFMVHPNSPTGNALTSAELEWLRQLPEQVLVVVDEAYFEFSQTSVVTELQQRSNWVILRTFSKAFRLAAHRVGYAIAHPELTAALEKVRLPYNLPATTQAAAQWALQHRQTLLAVIPMLLAERDRLFQVLSADPRLQVYPSAANFLFVQLQPSVSEFWQVSPEQGLEQVFQTLRAQGTLIRKISGGMRITVGTPAENQRTIDRLQQILG
ncbi:MAG: histidinol-phosphate transaminase [Elainellaceae cyanobacterium]